MAVALALVAALAYGAADFAGGLGARRAPVVAVVLGAQVVGLVVMLPLLAFFGPLSTAGLAAGAAAGAFGALGVTLLYRGLAVGRMGVVAPITGIGAALIPVAWDLARGNRPGLWALPGAMLALAAVVLVSAEDGEVVPRRWWGRPGVMLAVGSGVGFGLWFIALDAAPHDAGMWPVLGTRLASVGLVGVVALLGHVPVGRARAVAVPVAAAGLLDIAANASYLIATRHGLLAVVAVVTSLYPAATVALAAVVLRERLGGRRRAGLACALAGVALLSLA